MSHDDFAFEPIPGLPAPLPKGEHLLWQGAPAWTALAVRAYHVRKVALYFGVLIAWRVAFGIAHSHALSAIVLHSAFLALLGGACIGVLSLLAYLNARSTVYSITSRRILIRHGVAVPLTLNIPFRSIDGAAIGRRSGDSGEIALSLTRDERIGYLITWPHLRPGRFSRPEPSFRALPDAARAAEILSAALAADSAQAAPGAPIMAQPTSAAGAAAPELRARAAAA